MNGFLPTYPNSLSSADSDSVASADFVEAAPYLPTGNPKDNNANNSEASEGSDAPTQIFNDSASDEGVCLNIVKFSTVAVASAFSGAACYFLGFGCITSSIAAVSCPVIGLSKCTEAEDE